MVKNFIFINEIDVINILVEEFFNENGERNFVINLCFYFFNVRFFFCLVVGFLDLSFFFLSINF